MGQQGLAGARRGQWLQRRKVGPLGQQGQAAPAAALGPPGPCTGGRSWQGVGAKGGHHGLQEAPVGIRQVATVFPPTGRGSSPAWAIAAGQTGPG